MVAFGKVLPNELLWELCIVLPFKVRNIGTTCAKLHLYLGPTTKRRMAKISASRKMLVRIRGFPSNALVHEYQPKIVGALWVNDLAPEESYHALTRRVPQGQGTGYEVIYEVTGAEAAINAIIIEKYPDALIAYHPIPA